MPPARSDATLDCLLTRLAGDGECFFPLDGVPRALGVRGFFPGVLNGVVLAPRAGVLWNTAGGDNEEERAEDSDCFDIVALGVRGVASRIGASSFLGAAFNDNEAGRTLRRAFVEIEGARLIGDTDEAGRLF